MTRVPAFPWVAVATAVTAGAAVGVAQALLGLPDLVGTLGGAAAGLAAAALAVRWWRGQPDAVTDRLDPRVRWPDRPTRTRYLAAAVLGWIVILIAAYAVIPAAGRPAIGAVNVALLLVVFYLGLPRPAPQPTATGDTVDQPAAADGDESTFDWLAFLFASELSDARDRRPAARPTGTGVPVTDVPLDSLQAAWEAENRDLERLNPGTPQTPFRRG